MQASTHYEIDYNIINIISQLLFGFCDIVSKFSVFALPLIETTKASDFNPCSRKRARALVGDNDYTYCF